MRMPTKDVSHAKETLSLQVFISVFHKTCKEADKTTRLKTMGVIVAFVDFFILGLEFVFSKKSIENPQSKISNPPDTSVICRACIRGDELKSRQKSKTGKF